MKLLLLLYVPRSGSTFFADLLARSYSQVMVLPEMRLPRSLVNTEFPDPRPDKQKLLGLVAQDHQLRALDVSAQELEQCIDAMKRFDAEEFLLAIAGLLAARRGWSPEAVLYKCGSAANRWRSMRERLPNTHFIHVFRDARAAVNSAMHTSRPYHPGHTMGRGDPWFRARGWNRYLGNMERLKAAGAPLVEVKFEDLCTAPEESLRRVASELGLTESASDGSGLEIAARESDIHARVGKAAAPARIDAWQDELPAWQGQVVEFVAAVQLRRRGYAVWFGKRAGPFGRAAAIAYGYLFHLVATFYFHLRRPLRRRPAVTRS